MAGAVVHDRRAKGDVQHLPGVELVEHGGQVGVGEAVGLGARAGSAETW